MTIKISAVIVNFNGSKWLKNLFSCLNHQTFTNFEIIFVDNASEDESLKILEKIKIKNKIKIIKNKINYGFAKGSNIGAKNAQGEFIVLINTDLIFFKNAFEKILNELEIDKNIAAIQPKIKLMANRSLLDSCGSLWTNFSLLYHIGNEDYSNKDIYSKSFEVFSNKGAFMAIRKEVIDRIGLFDDDFWCYYEETDFCHRAHLHGYKVVYSPVTSCYHYNGGSSKNFDNSYVQFHSIKNKIMSFIKNFEILNVFKNLMCLFLIYFCYSIYLLIRMKFKTSLSIYMAFFWNIKNIKKTLKKRKIVQKIRNKKDNDYLFNITKKIKITYILWLIGYKRKI